MSTTADPRPLTGEPVSLDLLEHPLEPARE